MDRRDFLRFFGVGAAVVPIVGGMPHSDAAAVLVETPKIEPYTPKVKEASVAEMNGLTNGQLRVDIDITQVKPFPAHFHYDGGSFVIWADRGTIEVTAMKGGIDSAGPGRWNTDFLPHLQKPAECEFHIHARYKITQERKLFKTGSNTFGLG